MASPTRVPVPLSPRTASLQSPPATVAARPSRHDPDRAETAPLESVPCRLPESATAHTLCPPADPAVRPPQTRARPGSAASSPVPLDAPAAAFRSAPHGLTAANSAPPQSHLRDPAAPSSAPCHPAPHSIRLAATPRDAPAPPQSPRTQPPATNPTRSARNFVSFVSSRLPSHNIWVRVHLVP